MSVFAKIRRLFMQHDKHEKGGATVGMWRNEDEAATLGKTAENFLEALGDLEEINPCLKCGDLFLCRHKTCPSCDDPNQKYKEFTNEDQWRAENKVNSAVNELHEACRAL